jgi:hypothetical protein
LATRVLLNRSGPGGSLVQPSLVLWDGTTGEKRTEIPLHSAEDGRGQIETICWSSDETRLAVESSSMVYDIPSGRPLYTLPSDARPVVMGNSIGFHVDVNGREFALLYQQENAVRFRSLIDGRAARGMSMFVNERLGDVQKLEYSPAGRYVVGELSMTTTNSTRGSDDFYRTQSGLRHQDLFRRADGRSLLTLTNDRVWKWADGDLYVITERGRVYDTVKGQLLHPEPARAYHSLLETVGGGRFVPGFGDVRTGKVVGTVLGSCGVPTRGFQGDTAASYMISSTSGVWIWQANGDLILRSFVPRQPFTADPEIVQLWTEVLSRHELDVRGEISKLDELSWEQRRRRLTERSASDPSPILEAVAGDRYFWHRREGIAARLDERIRAIITDPRNDKERYRQALEWAIKSCAIVGEEGRSYPFDLCLNALGAAQFRCGLLREARTTLMRSNELSGGKFPSDLGFLAMTFSRLGEAKAARETLDKLERVLEDRRSAEHNDLALLREAESMILDADFPAIPLAP